MRGTGRRTLARALLFSGVPDEASVPRTPDTGRMPRSNRPRRLAGRTRRPPVDAEDLENRLVHAGGRLEEHPDGAWRVRQVPGAGGTKAHLFPGFRQGIAPRTPHGVAWAPARGRAPPGARGP